MVSIATSVTCAHGRQHARMPLAFVWQFFFSSE